MDADRLPRWRPLLLVGALACLAHGHLANGFRGLGRPGDDNSLSPTEGQYINAYTPVTLQVQVTNEDIGGSSDPVTWNGRLVPRVRQPVRPTAGTGPGPSPA